MSETLDAWPAGMTWVFQGTVAEDATAGTHVCTLTVSPGAGNEMTVEYGQLTVGNTATAQTPQVYIDDGNSTSALNSLFWLLNAGNGSGTTANLVYPFPTPATSTATAATSNGLTSGRWIVSGTQRLILKISTAAVSVTQTFAVVCRIKGAPPTATLADSVGTPTLTTNTNKVF